MKTPLSLAARLPMAALLFSLAAIYPALAQNGTQAAATPATQDAQAAPAPAATTSDDSTPPIVDRASRTVTQNTDEAWSMLKLAAADGKKPENRVAAVTAIGTIQSSRIAHKLISDALGDSDLDVRIAGVLAVETTKDKLLQNKLREMLYDKDPAVVFISALSLWKMGDKSGEDVLMTVINGERKSDAGLLKGAGRDANKELHSPAKMAAFGAKQGAGMLLGPFGIGMSAWDYAHKHNGEDPRITAISLISETKSPTVRNSLLAALGDKDAVVRAAAVRALGDYRDKSTATSLLLTFNDGKLSVRLLGAASYIRATSNTPMHTPAKK